MQLSDSTLDILRNFSAINQNILIKADSPIKTISEARNVVARADIPEKFLKDFDKFIKQRSSANITKAKIKLAKGPPNAIRFL